jgi:hypothetical protein
MIPDNLQIIEPPEGFRAQLEAVLQRIPDIERERLFQFWSETRRNAIAFPTRNRIRFRDDGMGDACTLAQGRQISFHRRVWRDNDAEYISKLIAHELAHVYDWAVGPMSKYRGQSDHPPKEEPVKMERRAIELAARWGFASPDGKPEHEHYAKYANRILNELPPAHPSVMYLRGVSESGLVPLTADENW